jgi:hypothetical protein
MRRQAVMKTKITPAALFKKRLEKRHDKCYIFALFPEKEVNILEEITQLKTAQNAFLTNHVSLVGSFTFVTSIKLSSVAKTSRS